MAENRDTNCNNLVKKIFHEKTCSNCGKILVRPCFAEYAYKIENKFFCSWTCMRRFEEKHNIDIPAKKKSSKSRGDK